MSSTTTIRYAHTCEGVTARQLHGFFDGWPDPPSPATHLRLLHNSDEIVLAIDEDTGAVIGFITAITDRVLAAYIPLLEVRPAYRGRGIGTRLVQHMIHRLRDLYMIDLVCDAALQPFYAGLGMHTATGMMIRNYARQSGSPEHRD